MQREPRLGPECRAMSVVYNLTAAGSSMLAAPEGQSDFPLEYRRLLGLINAGGHVEELRGRLRPFTDQMIGDWLKELQNLKVIAAQPAGKVEDFTFTGRKAPRRPALLDEASRRLATPASA